jgi:sulfide:quinone oxidoreductase
VSKTVLVLGAGVGGLTTAATLRGLLPSEDKVILADRQFDGVLGLSLLWVLRGWRQPDAVKVKPSKQSLPGVDMLTTGIESIDVETKTVHTTDNGPIRYDALVIALGASLNTAATPGLQEALDAGVAGQFYTLDGAAKLHQQIDAVQGGRVTVLVAAVPFKCPAAPFEAAMLIADQLGDKHTSGRVTVNAYTPDPLPMLVAGPDVGKALVQLMQAKNVGFHGEKTVSGIDVAGKTLMFADGTSEAFDLLAVVPPHAPTAAAKSTGLGPAGWIPVDPKTLATTADGVWAIGDATALILANGKPLPKAAVFAEGEADVAAHQVARYLGYDAEDQQFTGDGACYVEIGANQAAKGAGNFFTDPAPQVTLHEPSEAYHQEKAAQEADWLARWNQ